MESGELQIPQQEEGSHKNPFSRLKLWQKIGIGIAAVILIIIFIAVVFPKPSDENLSAGQRLKNAFAPDSATSDQQSCDNNKQLFTTSVIQPSDISTIVPLGNLAPPGHILPTLHVYYRYLRTSRGPKLTNIYAPADMTVTRITMSDNNSAHVPFISYKVEYSLCKEVQGYFILVINLTDKLKSAFHEPYDKVETSNVGMSTPDHNYWKTVFVKLKAGELIGTGGGGPDLPDALDAGLTDTRSPVPAIANPSRWPQQEQHYVCPVDYYPENIKQALYSKFGDFDGNVLTIDEPKCGSVYQDVPGTAQGTWVSKTSTGSWLWDVPNNLALVHSNFNHKEGVFSMGNIFRQLGIDNSTLYHFAPQTTGSMNRDFNNVTANGTVYCYETRNTQGNAGLTLLVQLLDAKTLRIGKLDARACGSGPWRFSAYLDFVR